MRKRRWGWGEGQSAPFPKSRASYFCFARFNMSPLSESLAQVVLHHHGTRGVDGPPSPEHLICCSISKPFCLQWKAFDLLYKMRYILWVVALLEVCDVTKHGRHLGFYQYLQIR